MKPARQVAVATKARCTFKHDLEWRSADLGAEKRSAHVRCEGGFGGGSSMSGRNREDHQSIVV